MRARAPHSRVGGGAPESLNETRARLLRKIADLQALQQSTTHAPERDACARRVAALQARVDALGQQAVPLELLQELHSAMLASHMAALVPRRAAGGAPGRQVDAMETALAAAMWMTLVGRR